MIEAKPRRLQTLEVNDADDGLVVYDPARGMVHHLNPTAAIIFDLCDGTRDSDAIARVLGEVGALDVPPLDAVREGLRELAERGLIADTQDATD